MNITKFYFAAITLTLVVLIGFGCTTTPPPVQQEECPPGDLPPIELTDDVAKIIAMSGEAFGHRPIPSGVLYTDLQQHTFSTEGQDMYPDVYIADDYGASKLAFCSTEQCPTPDIFVKSLHGTAVEQKTTHPASDIQPAFSPDGKFISFASDRNGNWDIFIIKAEGQTTTWQVTTSQNDDLHPSWSPDGSKLVYMSKSVTCDWDLWVYDLNTRSLTNIGPGLFPRWSPTGDRIIFQRPRQRNQPWYSVWSVKPDGTNLTEIVSDANWAAVTPAVSPDGRRVVFATIHKTPALDDEESIRMADDIWIADITGGSMIQLTVEPDSDWNPVWGKDGRIYFVSNRNGNTNIWSIRPLQIDVVGKAGSESAQEQQ